MSSPGAIGTETLLTNLPLSSHNYKHTTAVATQHQAPPWMAVTGHCIHNKPFDSSYITMHCLRLRFLSDTEAAVAYCQKNQWPLLSQVTKGGTKPSMPAISDTNIGTRVLSAVSIREKHVRTVHAAAM